MFHAYAERLPVKVFTSADGLGSSFIISIMRDSRGFIWFCTRDGLSRFDGSEFITYKLNKEESAPTVNYIIETRNGTYFVSTASGMYSFDSKTVAQADAVDKNRPVLNAKFMGNHSGVFLEDRQGVMWMATGGGLYRAKFTDDKISFERIDLHLPEKIREGLILADITEANDGSLWLAGNYGVVRRVPDGRTVFYPNDKNPNSSVAFDKDGRVWMTLGRRLQVFKPEPVESLSKTEQAAVISPKPTKIVSLKPNEEFQLPHRVGEVFQFAESNDSLLKYLTLKLFKSSDGIMWLTTNDGLYEFNNNRVRFYSGEQGFPPLLSHIAEDIAGNLWIGGQTGVIRLDRKGLTTYGTSDGLKSTAIYAIGESKDGSLYIANGDFYLSRFDGNKFQTLRPRLPSDVSSAWTSRYAFNDSRGGWWILTEQGLYYFADVKDFSALGSKTAQVVYGTRTGFKDNRMFQIFEDSHGVVWVSTRGGKVESRGLARFNREEGKFYKLSESDGFPAGRTVTSFAEEAKGNLWFSFYESGLARYSNGKFTVFSEKEGLPNNGVISDLLIDKKGRLWLSTSSGGVSRIDNLNSDKIQSAASYTTKNGLSSDNIRTIVEDNYGNIYAGTVRGVDRISPDTEKIKHYSVNDGLASDFVVDSYCDKNGTIWFAATNGLSKIIPKQDEKTSSPSIWLGGLKIAGEPQNISALGDTNFGDVELSHTQNNLQIDFFGLDFRAGETLRYQYKLEGADTDWSVPTQQRTVSFANLQSGTYRFFVRAINSDGNVSENPAVVSFKILPPVWKRWWFIGLGLLLVSALLYSFYRYRMAKLREVNTALAEAKLAEEKLSRAREERIIELERVRTRIATDLHDDIGASLTQIAILSEVAQQQTKSGNGAATQPLKAISNVSNELVGTMSDIVWAINPQRDHLRDLTQRMLRFASDVLPPKKIMFDFNAPNIENDIPLGANLRREVFLIFKESLNNIVKYSNATHVDIGFKFTDENLELRITDNGIGFDVEKITPSLFANERGGNGIFSMKKRAKEMDGKFEIKSEIGHGTTMSLQLPLEHHLPKENMFTIQTGDDKRNKSP